MTRTVQHCCSEVSRSCDKKFHVVSGIRPPQQHGGGHYLANQLFPVRYAIATFDHVALWRVMFSCVYDPSKPREKDVGLAKL